ncbi:indolepyruvate ferredoxin oxidoreductase family protein [Microbulbifer thermotolerans]|uniref:indolepyruvate ferredoxin oxidoreductase family protein n=1 Tax=Microbulbifer thermotolerans TaxID=252514 RepID=UPI00224AC6D9|nr:indolepyruvate ferredoxin oxidoreductase family protein [Microbulbifer thermotolerans]MCX2780024.1 indolepyruvate ferredoxin oxidoreductase family protein [Microbulbifer thermotolerans]MCX2805447.1 indolepyruvate ferredoxin oxidoreductase family protein [Microbulbifer thermotolerans]
MSEIASGVQDTARAQESGPVREVSLDDRYTTLKGRVLLSGIQALVRLPIDQMRMDRARGLKTAVFISGYRGSPLGGYDQQLVRAKKLLDAHNIRFQPGVNEELAATAVWGSQQVGLFEGAEVDGVCGIWYGKTPGVDRSCDAFRHANAAGSSAHGGALIVAGDDHGCKSSSYPGQSEFAFVDMHIPVLNPATVQEVLDYGHYGLELSRFSGCWVAMITLAENMDSSATVDVDPERVQFSYPEIERPEGGLNIRKQDNPLEQEERLWRYKRPAALAFARANKLNRVVLENPDASLGIVSTGKAHLDLMQAFEDMGIDERKARALGIRILKVGMTYPLDVPGIQEFARGLDTLLVLEEKRSLMEVQLKEELYNVHLKDPHFPRILGKVDENDRPLMPMYGELSPAIVAQVLGKILGEKLDETARHRLSRLDALAQRISQNAGANVSRLPMFCAGCPHNRSTRVPEGSRALAGIGCHYMAQWLDRETYTFTQMGGEGVNWIGQSAFTREKHVFVNLGDGTYFHSGILAIRAAVAAKVNITYKILFNDAVAMTGGQPHDGELTPDMICRQVLSEGVRKVVLVLDNLDKYKGALHFPREVEVRHRDHLPVVMEALREIEGCTVILYDQTCATELRRKRKRGLLPKAEGRPFINERVCEGCGDCVQQSSCIAVEKVETAFGDKRRVNQTGCNQDMSCVNGFCPSFVTVKGGELAKRAGVGDVLLTEADKLSQPELPSLDAPYNLLVTGVGGTGVVTIGALLAMAAHIEGKASSTLDQTGLAQKGGAVYSHVRLAAAPGELKAVRISDGRADALMACDLIAAGNLQACLAKLDETHSRAVVNTHLTPTAASVLGREDVHSPQVVLDSLGAAVKVLETVEAHKLTSAALGDTLAANIFMLGFAWQKGLIPLGREALTQAIALNGVAVEANLQGFAAGRLAAANRDKLDALLAGAAEEVGLPRGLEEIVAHRVHHLTGYQNSKLARRYRDLVDRVKAAEILKVPGSEALAEVVARNYAKLLAYKDEYEVARLYTDGEFAKALRENFSGDFALEFNLAPPLLSPFDKALGRPRKLKFGGWMYKAFGLLAKLKVLRGTPLDIFGYTAERKIERALIGEYEQLVDRVIGELNAENHAAAIELLSYPDAIRGYGPVKEVSLDRARKLRSAALRRFENPGAELNESAPVAVFDPAKAQQVG